MAWTVTSKKKAQKQAQKLPSEIKKILARLLMEIEIAAPLEVIGKTTGRWAKTSIIAT